LPLRDFGTARHPATPRASRAPSPAAHHRGRAWEPSEGSHVNCGHAARSAIAACCAGLGPDGEWPGKAQRRRGRERAADDRNHCHGSHYILHILPDKFSWSRRPVGRDRNRLPFGPGKTTVSVVCANGGRAAGKSGAARQRSWPPRPTPGARFPARDPRTRRIG